MHGLNLLIIESSGWSHTCAAWIAGRGHRVSIAPAWPSVSSMLKQRAYDLILLDESLWLANMSAAGKFFQEGRHIAIISSKYSREAYRKAVQAGAKGYISKQLDQDTFIRELEKALRKAGILAKQGRVLVVDNDTHVLNALKNNLEREGYEVCIASNAEDAKSSIEMNQPHVAVVDIRLTDDDDSLDQSGFDLIREINDQYGHATKVVGLTGSPIRQTASHAAGLVSGFVLKDSKLGTGELVRKIEVAREELEINVSLDIEFEEPLSLLGLVKMMKVYRNLGKEQQERVTIELEELIRKLFRRELKVKGYYLSPGRGGSGVVLMRPVVEGTKGQYFVIKFGPRENVAIELNNYNLYVKPFISKRATQLVDIVDNPIETLNLGGLKFSFAGMSVDKPQDFNTFYRDPNITEDQICTSLWYLFHETCAEWYQAKRDWSDVSPGALAKAYESQLSLDQPDKQRELVTMLERLLNGKTFHGISFGRHGRDRIKVRLEEKELVFPRPLLLVKQHRTSFPAPRFDCRTHGDLNGRNMFVDEDARVWLIDFFKTGWGPILRDFGELETVIKFELIDTHNLTALYDFEKALLTPGRFDEPIEFINRFQGGFNRALAVIAKLRNLAQEQFESSDMREYYVGLLFYAIRMLTWEGISSAEKERYPVRQRHALLSAAMIAYRLEHWGDKWEGWPDERAEMYAG